MNQDIQEISFEEIEQVNGSTHDTARSTTQAIDYPEVVNNPPG